VKAQERQSPKTTLPLKCYSLAHICPVGEDYVTLWIPALKVTVLWTKAIIRESPYILEQGEAKKNIHFYYSVNPIWHIGRVHNAHPKYQTNKPSPCVGCVISEKMHEISCWNKAWEAQGRWGTNLLVSMNGSGCPWGHLPCLAHATLHIPIVCNKAKPRPNIQPHGASQYLIAMDRSPSNHTGHTHASTVPGDRFTHGVIKTNSDTIVTSKLTFWLNGIVASHT
jgi:hypothetical protein